MKNEVVQNAGTREHLQHNAGNKSLRIDVNESENENIKYFKKRRERKAIDNKNEWDKTWFTHKQFPIQLCWNAWMHE